MTPRAVINPFLNLPNSEPSASGAHGRFERSLTIARLRHLDRLDLASRDGPESWHMVSGWQDSLRAMGRRDDIIRPLSNSAGRDSSAEAAQFDPAAKNQKAVLGRVLADGPGDELKDTRFLAVESADGRLWHVPVENQIPGALPPPGAIVKVSPATGRPKQADRTIAAIAAANGGVYSDALHEADDPSARPAYRDAHKRRLEALRRRGIVERMPDGSFAIPEDYLERASAFGARSARTDMKSWIGLEQQVEAEGTAWIDEVGVEGRGRFGRALDEARKSRADFLQRERQDDPSTSSNEQPSFE